MPASPRALTLRLATGIVLVEAVCVWAYIALLSVDAAGEPGGWRVIGYFGLYAVAFTFLAQALWRRKRWARAPLIVLQLLLSVAGFSLISNGSAVPGLAILVVAVGCAGLLLPTTTYESLG